MPNNILITPGSASIQFSGSNANTIRLQVEPSGSIAFYGNSGSLFGITDSLVGSLMSVNDISGLPILEVFSDDRVVMGTYNQNTLVVTGSRVGMGTATPQSVLHVSGTVSYGSVRISPTAAAGESAIAFFTDVAGTDTNDAWVVGHAGWGNTGDFVIGNENNGAGGNVRLLIEKAGNVGINDTSPGTKLVISHQGTINTTTPGTTLYNIHFTGLSTNDNAQGITFNGGGSGAQAGLYVQGSSAYGTKMYFATTNDYGAGSKTRMMIDHSGNVGIGITSPTTTFDVNGSARIVTALGVGTAPSANQGEIRATHEVTAYYSSDARLKENINPLSNALNKLLQVNGVEFDWTEEYINKRGGEDGYFVRKHDVGIIAQEIKEVLPEVVAEREDGYLAVRYEKIVPLLIEAIKELQAEIAELKRQS
jgi:hypothetical protein